MTVYTIYQDAPDQTEKFVVRCHNNMIPDPEIYMGGDDVEVIREHLMDLGLTSVSRSPEDDRVILESWI